MSSLMHSLGVDRLGADEQLRLVDEILENLTDRSEPVLTETQRQELARRIALIDSGATTLVPWEQVEARLLQQKNDVDDARNPTDADRWTELLQIGHVTTARFCSVLHQMADKTECLRRALNKASERRTALSILLVCHYTEVTKALFPLLVDLASVEHCDITLCRRAIKSIPLDWVRHNIMSSVATTLRTVSDSPEDTEEAYRRFAELLYEIDADLLQALVKEALQHPYEGVREVGQDFMTPE